LGSGGQVLAEVNGCLGVAMLNRPEALNALSLPMIRDLANLLAHWQAHPQVQAVLLMAAPSGDARPTAFCAGGDIRFFHRAAQAGDPDLAEFFTAEYRLNHQIHGYPKPFIALMDGVVMGGGMGLAQGAKLRVLNERSRLAMPEARIGFFPDVGGGHFLGQCPGATGEWLALSGESLGAGDAIALGLGDVFVPTSGWDGMVRELRHGAQPNAEHVVATVMEGVELAPETHRLAQRALIDACFSQADVASIQLALQADASPWAVETLAQMRANSPLAMATSLALVRRARHLELADELRLERNLAHWFFEPAARGQHSEVVEGIRAISIDKDRSPAWLPGPVSAAQVEALFTDPWPAGQHPLADLR